MKPASSIAAAFALAGLLSACGGGVTFGDFDDEDSRDNVPVASNLPASVTVQGASDVQLNGTYSTPSTLLNEVWRYFATGSHPETCRFRFGGLQQPGQNRVMSGEIWYLPESTTVHLATFSINGQEFDLQDTRAATADRAANQVVFQAATLRSTESVETITVDGTIPIRPDHKARGC